VLVSAVAILVVGGFLLTGCGSESTATGHGAAHSAGDVAPDLRLTTIDGERVALGDYLGRPVAVMFMHSY
tara:strand:- start:435 stop:644 length:210 start_codon:yes stop_codon:yes gene_type:complete